MIPCDHTKCRLCVPCWIDRDRCLRVTFLAGARISLRDARRITAACSALTEGIPRPAIVDFRRARAIEWRAQRYFFRDPNHLETYCAVAILVRTEIGRIVGELFRRLLRPKKPARLFTCERAARAWLLPGAQAQEAAAGSVEPYCFRRNKA
jgi:hypothetical protein